MAAGFTIDPADIIKVDFIECAAPTVNDQENAQPSVHLHRRFMHRQPRSRWLRRGHGNTTATIANSLVDSKKPRTIEWNYWPSSRVLEP